MIMLGHKFQPMTAADWNGFAGAEPGTLICHPCDGTTLLFDPTTGIVSEVRCDGSGHMHQRDWTSAEVIAEPGYNEETE